MMLHILLFLMLNISPATQSDRLFVASDSLFNDNGILHLGSREGWRFQPGDNIDWAKPEFDDSEWMFYKPTGLTEPIPDSLWNGFGWFRYRFVADSSAYAKITHLYFYTWGAAEVYLDGKLVQKYGVFSTEMKSEKRYLPYRKTYPAIVLHPGESHVMAVRFSYHKGQHYKKLLGKYARTFGFSIGLTNDNFGQQAIWSVNNFWRNFYILSTMMFLIMLLHGFLYVLFPDEHSNLYIAIVAFLLFLIIILGYGTLFLEFDILQYIVFIQILLRILFLAALSMFPFTINSLFNQRPRKVHKMLIWLFPFFALANFILSGPGTNIIITIIFASCIVFFSSQVLFRAWRNKQKGVWFVAGAFLGSIIGTVAYIFYSKFSQNSRIGISAVLSYIMFASFPLGLTAFMASRFRDLYTNLEYKVRERTRELNQSLEELRSTQSQLIQSEKMASLGQLTAGIAHEIQNPLNFVNNFSEISSELLHEMKEELATGNLKPATGLADDIILNLEKITHHGKRAESIVKGMLLHSRGNSGHKELVDINALCDEYLRLSYHGFRAKDKSFNADFKLEADKSLPKIEVVPQDIGRVLLNLINNAFYAVDKKAKKIDPLPPKGGSEETGINYKPTINISTTSSKSPSGDLGVKISVKDNGEGIPDEIKDKIFQPFFTTKPTGQGTGLGLSLAYDMVKAHGGEIKVNTKSARSGADGENEGLPGEQTGTEFTIILPA